MTRKGKSLHHIILNLWINHGCNKSIIMQTLSWRWKHDQWQCCNRVKITNVDLLNSFPREVICHFNGTGNETTTKTAATTKSPENDSSRRSDVLEGKEANWKLIAVIWFCHVTGWKPLKPLIYRLLDAVAKIEFITACEDHLLLISYPWFNMPFISHTLSSINAIIAAPVK